MGITPSLYEWVVGKDFLFSAFDPWERTQKLLIEIQKRSLAEQVLLITGDVKKGQSKVIGMSPSIEKIIVPAKLRTALVIKSFEERRPLQWEDLWADAFIKQHLERSRCHTLLLYPLTLKESIVDILLIVNSSRWSSSSQLMDFNAFASSVVALSLQNLRLYSELKKKNAELKNWASHVEERIEEGTKRLLEKESQYSTLFEGTKDGILIHDVSGNLIEANGQACQLLGYEKKELLNLRWSQLGISDLLPEQMLFFSKISKKEDVNPLDTMLRRKDGSTFRAELSSQRVRFRGTEALQSFIHDVSSEKTMDAKAREVKEKYRVFIESSLVGVFILRNGAVHFANSMFEEITGYTNEELLEKRFSGLIVPEDRKAVEEKETRREKGEEVPEQYEVRFLKKDGERIWCEVRACRIDFDGTAAVLGNVIDISQRKQTQTQLLETQKMESIATLAGGIAHDFNNLLGGILGYASLLLSEMKEGHPYYDDIHAIADTTKRAAELTNRLLAFARGGKYQVTAISMHRVSEGVQKILSRTPDGSIVVETDLEEDLWPVRGDSQQIQQAFLNVCLNAKDAMPNGGKLTIRMSNIDLDTTSAAHQLGLKKGEYVRIVISDTGMGMDEKTKARMFEPFFTTKSTGEGTGLGLSMVYGIVKNHDGAITVDSEVGRGTRITIFLPRFFEEVKPEVKPIPEKAPEKPDKKERILFVDDEEVIRQVVQRMLEKGGYEVSVARNGKEALEIYRKRRQSIDLVLLDLIMPVMGGKETCRRLKQFDPSVKVAFTSGYGIDDMAESKFFHDIGFIQKPFQTEVLIQKVQEVLGKPPADR